MSGIKAPAVLRGLLRRDRLTGQVAIGAVGLLLVTAMVYGVGIASARYKISDVGAWLSATSKGMIVHANGLIGKVDGKTNLAATARGHRIKIIQDGGTVLLVDETTGAVSRVDPSQLKVEQTANLGLKVQIVANADVAYTVDQYKGVVQQIDPVKLTPVGKATSVEPPVGLAGLDARGTLWVPSPQTGQLIPFQNGVQGAPVAVAAPRDQLQLSIVAGVPTVLDLTTGTAAIVGGDGVRKIDLPDSLGSSLKVPAVVEGQNLPILGPKGALVLLDTGSGGLTSISLRLPPRDALREPQILGSKVYIPDETAGALIVYDYISGKISQPISVSGMPGPLDVFVKDGILWANDPNRDAAVSVDQGGVPKHIKKYDAKAPGGVRKPIPSQGSGSGNRGDGNRGGGNGRDPGNGGNQPQQPRPPKPNQPPRAPQIVNATGDGGTVTIDFQRSQESNVPATGYLLQSTDGQSVPKASPSGPVPAAGPYRFVVSGLTCGTQFRFRLVVQYRDPKTQSIRNGDFTQRAVPACKEPAAPAGLVAKSDNDGSITVTFKEGENPAAVTEYVLTDEGDAPMPNVPTVKRGAPLQFRPANLNCSKEYTFKVTARYTKSGGTGSAPSQETTSSLRPCTVPGTPSGFVAKGTNHTADLSWDKVPGYQVTYNVAGTNAPGSVSGTAAKVDGLTNNQSYTYTLTAQNGAGSSTSSASATADLTYQQQSFQNKANNQTNTIIRPAPSKSGEIGKIPQGKYQQITVICQVKGESVTEGETGETSVWWDRIQWGGQEGYLSVTLMEGPREPSGTMFEC